MENSVNIWSAFFKTGSMLLVVIATLLILLYLLKRFSNFKILKTEKGNINIIEVRHFSPKEKLVLIDVMGTTILVGVTGQSMTTLATIEGVSNSENRKTSPSEESVKNFGNIFKKRREDED